MWFVTVIHAFAARTRFRGGSAAHKAISLGHRDGSRNGGSLRSSFKYPISSLQALRAMFADGSFELPERLQLGCSGGKTAVGNLANAIKLSGPNPASLHLSNSSVMMPSCPIPETQRRITCRLPNNIHHQRAYRRERMSCVTGPSGSFPAKASSQLRRPYFSARHSILLQSM